MAEARATASCYRLLENPLRKFGSYKHAWRRSALQRRIIHESVKYPKITKWSSSPVVFPGNGVHDRIVGSWVPPRQHSASGLFIANNSCHLLALALILGKVDGVIEGSGFSPVLLVTFLGDNCIFLSVTIYQTLRHPQIKYTGNTAGLVGKNTNSLSTKQIRVDQQSHTAHPPTHQEQF